VGEASDPAIAEKAITSLEKATMVMSKGNGCIKKERKDSDGINVEQFLAFQQPPELYISSKGGGLPMAESTTKVEEHQLTSPR